jgi:hypothetical protein
MNSDAVIGCDAVDVGTEWLRLTTATGAVRTIPWSAIRVAGMGAGLEGHVTIQGVTEKVAPFRATHDSLWIIYTDGAMAQLMLEKTSPKREAVRDAFAQHLGDRWHGDDLSADQLMGPMMIPPKVQMPKTLIVMMAGIGIVFFLAMAILYFMHGAKPTSP